MNQVEWIETKIAELIAEIERIEKTFPPESAMILVKDKNAQLDSLYEQICPF